MRRPVASKSLKRHNNNNNNNSSSSNTKQTNRNQSVEGDMDTSPSENVTRATLPAADSSGSAGGAVGEVLPPVVRN